jgi:hypothetical protein
MGNDTSVFAGGNLDEEDKEADKRCNKIRE